MTHAASYIFQRQTLWARRRGILLCGSAGERGRLAYTRALNDNLFEPLSPEAKSEYASGDGGELGRDAGKPGKMQALHSSSALGCNAFHYWRRIDRMDIVLQACGLPTRGVERTQFEGQLPISPRFRYAPNLDVVVTYKSGDVVLAGIECKFGEPFSTRDKVPLSEKYLDSTLDGLWTAAPTLRELAGRCVKPNDGAFKHLDVSQLLKHSLGLRRRANGGGGHLLYLFCDVPGIEGARHARELLDFGNAAQRDGVRFSAVSYQDVLLRLAAERDRHTAWVDYMAERYL